MLLSPETEIAATILTADGLIEVGDGTCIALVIQNHETEAVSLEKAYALVSVPVEEASL